MEEKSRAVRSVESEETFNDYEFSPVPDEKKNTWKAQVFVWPPRVNAVRQKPTPSQTKTWALAFGPLSRQCLWAASF